MKFALLAKSTVALTCGIAIAASTIALPASAGSKQIRQGLPGRRISGGVRSEECFKDSSQSLVAITPRNLLGKTAQAHPAFWFSLPETQSAKSIHFELFDSADNVIYSTQLDRSYASGLSKIELPKTAPALEPDENYRWVFDISCENSPSDTSLEVQGWVRRVELSSELSAQMASASPAEQAYLYEEAGLWHEQVTALAELRDLSPTDLEAQLKWAALVQAAGLDNHLSSSPLETNVGIIGASTTQTAL